MELNCRLTVTGLSICLMLPLVVGEATAQVSVSKSSLTIDEGGEGSYKVHLQARPSDDITLDITTSNSDVRVKPSSLTFTRDNWDKPRLVTVEAVRDADIEDDRATVSHSLPPASARGSVSPNLQTTSAKDSSSVTVIVLDQDPPSHEVNISPSSGLSIRQGGSSNYRVSLTEAPTASVTVWASSDRSDVQVSPSSLTFYVGTWSGSKTFTVSVDADATSTGASISHSATSEDFNYQGLNIDTLPVTVLQPPAGITQPPSQTRVLVGQTKVFYSPRLRSQPTGTVTISASSQAAGTASVTGSKGFSTGNWNTTQDFRVTGQSVGSTTIAFGVDSSDSRYDGYDLNSTSVTVEATTITCRADDTNIQLGGSFALSWDSTNADSVTIDQGVGTVPLDSPRGGKTVTPPQLGAGETSKSTTYRFTAAGGGDPGTCSVTVTVWRPPNVGRFSAASATLRKQQTARLTWATSHASGVTIDRGIGTVPVDSSQGGRDVTPPQPSSGETSRNTSYRLTASNPAYTGADAATATVSVTVWNRPSVDSFTASPSTIDEGEDSSLKWTTTHATNVSIDQGVGSVSVDDESGNTRVSPDQGTTYTLTASNPAYSGSHAVTGTVTVNPATVPQPPAGITQPPSSAKVLVGQTMVFYSPRLRSQPTGTVTISASSQAAGTASVTGSKSFSTGNWNTTQDFRVTGQSVGSTTIAFGVDSSDSRYGGYDLNSTSVTVEATTITCRADDTSIQLGGSTTLSWDSSNANSVTIDQGIGTVAVDSPGHGKSVTPPQPGAGETSKSTTYRFTAAGGGNPGTCSVTVTVWRPPNVGRFSAAPATLRKQQTARLTWATSHASGVAIDRGIGTVPVDSSQGGRGVTPSQPSTGETSRSTSYRLTASNPAYTGADAATATVSVTVWNRPSVDSFTASPSTINGGQDSRLKWTTTHATNVSIDQGVGSVSVDDVSGNTRVSLDQGTTYTLTASNPAYSGSHTVTDTVYVAVRSRASSPGLTVSPTSLNITEGTAGKTYNIRLKAKPSADVTVTVAIDSGGDERVRIDRSSLTFTTTDWNRDRTLRVSAEEQSGTATGQARITNTPPSSYGGSAVGVTVNVADDDSEGCGATVTPTGLSVDEGESDDGYYDVVLAARPTAGVTVSLDLTGDPSLSADKSALTFTTGNWNIPQRVTIEAGEDADSTDGRVTISHTASSTDEGCSGISIPSVSVNIRDNDEPPALPRITLSSDTTGVSEPDGTSRVTAAVASGEAPDDDLTVNLTHSGQAAHGVDYRIAALTIESGATSGEAELSVVDDPVVEGTEEIRLIAGADGYQESAPLSMDLTDDDSAGVTITPTQLTIGEGGSHGYEVVLTSQPAHDVTVAIAHSGDGDIGIDDQELTFTVSNWNQEQTVTVSSSHDDDAADDTATFSHASSSTDGDYNGITVSEVSVTATDDDSAGVTITPTQLTIGEGGSDSYDVVLTSQPAHDVTVTITRSGDGDIGIDDRELTFSDADWDTAQQMTVSSTRDDDAVDDTATLSHAVTSSDEDYNGITVSEVSVTVTDDDSAGVTITPTQLTIGEGGSDSYEVVLTSQPTHDVTITIAHSGDGDISVDNRELTFTVSNWNQEQTVTVSASNDDDAVDDTATLSHTVASTDTDYNGIVVSEVAVTATDDDSAGVSITPTQLTIDEGDSDSYDVVLTSQPSHDVTVTITRSGDGDIGVDDQELTFTGSNWNQEQTVTVSTTQDDDAVDDTAAFSHAASSTDGDYDGILVSEVSVAVNDDDSAGVTITPTQLTIGEGGSDSYEVVLTSQPTHDVTITIAHSGDGDISVDDRELTFTVSNWNQEQTVTVSSSQDDDAADDTATLSHTVASADGDYNGVTVSEVSVAVNDDDSAGVTITPTQLTIGEGGSDSYDVVLTSQPAHDVTVTITRSGDGDIGIDDRELTFTGSNWNQEQTVTVSSSQDDDAADDTGTLSHTVASADGDYNGVTVSEVSVAVNDDDSAGVTITPTQLTIREGDSDSYAVVLTSQPAHDVTVTIAHSGDGDISVDNRELTFTGSNWNQEQTVTVSASNDDDAVDDTATLSHTVASADGDYNGVTVSEVSVAVNDDDSAGVTITPTQLTIGEGGSDSYAVVLTSKPAHDVTITIAHRGDGDISVDDRELTFTVSNWNQEQTVTVSSSHDDDAADDTGTLSHTVASADGDYNGVTVSEVSVAVNDDDSAGVTITPTQLTIGEGGSDSYEVVLTSQPTHDVTVTVTRNGDGDIGVDDQELTFSGYIWNQAQTVTVSASQDDDAVDDTATFSHAASSTDGDYNGVTVSEVSVAVNDDDSAGVTITPTQLTIREGDSDSYEVVLTSRPSHDVTVTITHNGDGDIGIDDRELTFTGSNWNQEQAVTVSSSHDDDATDDAATLIHTAASTDTDYNGIAVSEVAVTVTDEDTAGVSITPTQLTIREGDSDSYEVVLTSKPTHDVTITIAHSGDGDIGVDDRELTFTGSNWNQEQTVTVSTTQDDDAVDDTAAFSHAASSTDGHYDGILVPEVSVTVNDDDSAGVTITPTQLTIGEGGSDSYEVVLTSQPTHDVTITIAHSGDGDIGVDDQELTFSGYIWNQAQTVTVSASQDDDAVDDTATFSHAASSSDADYKGITISEVSVTVTDDETAGVSITPTQLTIGEGGSDSYDVVLTSQPTHDVTVTITHRGDGDIGVDDRELAFPVSDWNQKQTVTVSASNDDGAVDDTATLSHTVSSTDGDYDGIMVSEVSVTATDDDTAGVSIIPTQLTIAEGASDSYEVVLTSRPSHDVMVTITHSGDTDIDIDDRELTFSGSNWNQEQAVTVSASQDDDAVDDTATLSHTVASTDTDYNGIAVSEVSVTVTDDDTAGVSITPTQLTIREGGSDSYAVVLTSQPTHEVTVTITHSGDGDIGIDDQELTFTGSNWNRAQTVTVSCSHDDDATDDTATFSHTVSSTDGDYNGIAASEVEVIVIDDETARVSILPAQLTIAEGDRDSYQVVLTSRPSHDVTISITHTGDPDIRIEKGTLIFTGASWNQPQTVTVEASPDDDAADDSARLAHAATSSDGSYDGLILREVRVSVRDDDSAGVRITPTHLSIPEGESRDYTVVLTSKPALAVVLEVSSDNSDLTPSPGSLTFDPADWDTPQTISARAAQDDDAIDDSARFSHAAAGADPTYQGISVDDLGIVVNDNDSAGVKVTPTRLEMPEDASTTYTVSLTSRPSRPVVVALSHSGDPDISANVAQVSFAPSEWETPGTVTVQASRDPDALDDSATLKHSASSTDSTYDGAPVDPVRITVGDLDSAGITITPLLLTIDEGYPGTYTVVLTSKPSQDVVVEVNRRGDEDVVPQPDSLTFTGSNWNKPQTVSVQALQDPDSADDTATLVHSTTSADGAYSGLAAPDVSVSVIDDDATGVSVSPQELNIREGGSQAFTVGLASKPSATVHLSLRSNNNDISTSQVSLTFSPATWSTTQEVSVAVAQDDDATDEFGTLTFSAASSDSTYHGIPVPEVSVDVTDDDTAGVRVVPNPHMSVPEGESATYTLVLLSQPMAAVAVAISSSNPRKLAVALNEVTFTRDNWNVAQPVAFETFHDDNTLDEKEVLSHTAVSPDPNYRDISVTPLQVTITDRTAEELTRTLPVLLSAMSGALAESIRTAVESRFERRRQLERMKQEQGWWMPTYYQDRSRHSPGFDPTAGPGTGPVLSRTSFGLPLAGNAFADSDWRPVLWGHGSFQHFNGSSSLVNFRGGLRATHVGMDLLSTRQVLTGLSFARSWGAMGYSDEREGRLAAAFNTFHPYLYWQPHRRLGFWGIGGMGRGSVDVRDPRLAHVFNSEFRMWAGGLRSLLTRPGNNELGLRVDGFTSNIGIDPYERIGEVSGKASRVRAMLEAVHQRGGRKRSFSLKSEIGGRVDRGEAVHGASMETGLRLGFIDNRSGLDLALQGRMLLFHEGGYRDWGAGLQASWDPGRKRRGLRMSAAASHGQVGPGGSTLWNRSFAHVPGPDKGLPADRVAVDRIDSQAAYGVEVLQGRGLLTPFSRLRWTGQGQQLSVGSEFGLQPPSPDTHPLNLELEGVRGKSSRGADMGVRIRMSIPF